MADKGESQSPLSYDEINSALEQKVVENEDSPGLEEAENLGLGERQRLENTRYDQDTQARKRYAGYTYWYLVGWTLLVLVLLFFYGFKLISLPESTLNFLITASTAKVIGLFAIVMLNLFPRDKPKS